MFNIFFFVGNIGVSYFCTGSYGRFFSRTMDSPQEMAQFRPLFPCEDLDSTFICGNEEKVVLA